MIRDAQALVDLGLLRRDDRAYRINLELVLAFLPRRYEGNAIRVE